MRIKLLIVPIIFILTVFFASAADFFIVDVEAVNNDIFVNDLAIFDITIYNGLTTQDVLTFSIQDTSWNLLKTQFQIPGEGQKTIRMEVYPTPTMTFGSYQFPIKIKSSKTGEFVEQVVTVNIQRFDPVFGEYRPSIQFGASIDKEVDPRSKIPVEIYMRNRNALDITFLQIVVSGDLFSDEFDTNLGPLDEKRTDYLFEVDPLTKPGLYSITVELKARNITLNSVTKSYQIMPYATVSMDSVEKRFLCKKTETIILENLGNAVTTKTVNLKMPWTKRIFTHSEPNSKVVEVDGKKTLEWEIEIGPQEASEIVVVSNYRIPVGIILLIIIVIVMYFQLRSPIVVGKEVIISGPADEGVEHLKLRLFVKNRSRKPVERVTVYDRVPGIAELIKKKVLGTIQPEKVTKQEKKGTLIKWNLETLEAYEERIITYEVKSKLKIIGNISLPSTRVTFLDKNKERRVYSQRIVVTN
ncbi:hypothetical protein ACFLTH_04325 [Bacteroidota bacterium]